MTDGSPAWRIQAHICSRPHRGGRPLPIADALVLVTAQNHGLTMLTRHLANFARHDKVFDRWQA